MNAFRYFKIAVVTVPVLLMGCRGQTTQKTPIHPNMNMDQQNRVEAQEENRFFFDNRAMRQPVEGTVARGGLRHDEAMFQGINEDSSFVRENPLELTKKLLRRGQERFNIYCTPCHGIAGDGKGVIITGGYGFVPPPSYHIDRLRNVNDGYIYSVITNGIRTMQSYAHQIPVKDRWAIVAYIRALQKSQNVSEEEMQQFDIDLASMKEQAQQKLAEEQAKKEAEEAAAAGAQITAAKGKELAASNTCATCHSVDGSKGVGPTWKNLYGHEVELADGSTVTADEDYLTESIVNSTAKTVAGFPEGAMADFSYLSSNDIKNIIAYIKSLSDEAPEESSGSEETEPQTENESNSSTEQADTTGNAATEKQAEPTVTATPDTTTQNTEPLTGSALNGKQLFQKYECLSCHYIKETKEDLAPSFKGLYGSIRKLQDGSSVVVDDGYIKESIQYPGAKIALGYNNNMPPFRDLLSDQDLQAIADYIKTLH